MCILGLSDREDWLDLNDRQLNAALPGLKPLLNPAAGKAPAPVVGPHLGPAVGPDPVAEPKGPSVPILAQPPTKVRFVILLKYFGNIS